MGCHWSSYVCEGKQVTTFGNIVSFILEMDRILKASFSYLSLTQPDVINVFPVGDGGAGGTNPSTSSPRAGHQVSPWLRCLLCIILNKYCKAGRHCWELTWKKLMQGIVHHYYCLYYTVCLHVFDYYCSLFNIIIMMKTEGKQMLRTHFMSLPEHLWWM